MFADRRTLDTESILTTIAQGRRADPLAPVTVIAPSHVAALQLRRRLAERTAFAAVRLETLPRLAELLAAGHLVTAGKSPLARPIGDYVAGRVALLSGGQLGRVRDLPGYARALRGVFARLRRGGIKRSSDVSISRGQRLDEILRLYESFRDMTAEFYDQEDLLDAAADAVQRGSGIITELGAVYVLPPGAETSGSHSFLAALRSAACSYLEAEGEEAANSETNMVLAQDPAGEVREVVREVISSLQAGLNVSDIAVFHGADQGYSSLLREAFTAANIPVAPMPGTPIADTVTGRAILSFLNLPNEDFSRVRTMDFLGLAPLRFDIPAEDGRVRPWPAAWDKVSRKAGVTRGAERWADGLQALIRDTEVEMSRRQEDEARTRKLTQDRDRALELHSVIVALIERLAALDEDQRAARFISSFADIVQDYFRRDAKGFEEVLREIEQLGTVDAVRGSFSLASFREALRANLEAGAIRSAGLGEGVLLAEYRAAAGLLFKHVIVCGAYEGAFPAGPGGDVILDDRAWSQLRHEHEHIEDAERRLERSRAAADRALAAADGGRLTWSCPLYEPGASREYFPSLLMVEAAAKHEPETTTAARLRRLPERPWLRRCPSPLGAMLRGPVADRGEVTLRSAVSTGRSGRAIDPSHTCWHAFEMLNARRSARFTEWDGNIAPLKQSGALGVRQDVYPTSLEDYATCGFRYLCKSVLRLSVVEEPEELEMMEPAAKGSLVHDVLERFYKLMKEQGRPQAHERWTEADRQVLRDLLRDALQDARARGRAGRDVYSGHEARTLRADLMGFLDADDEFRLLTGAVPAEFEVPTPETQIAGVTLRGRVDRVDRTPDGARAWVIDYKTGSTWGYDKIEKDDPLDGGRKLQLPVYRSAAGDAAEVQALYWFITQRAGFKQISFPDTTENLQRFERTIESIIDSIGAGVFPARSGEEDEQRGGWDNCKYCDFDRICSRRRDQEYTEMSGDEALEPWQRIAVVARDPEAGP